MPLNCISSSDVEEAWSLWKDIFWCCYSQDALEEVQNEALVFSSFNLKHHLYNKMTNSLNSDVIRCKYKSIRT